MHYRPAVWLTCFLMLLASGALSADNTPSTASERLSSRPAAIYREAATSGSWVASHRDLVEGSPDSTMWSIRDIPGPQYLFYSRPLPKTYSLSWRHSDGEARSIRLNLGLDARPETAVRPARLSVEWNPDGAIFIDQQGAGAKTLIAGDPTWSGATLDATAPITGKRSLLLAGGAFHHTRATLSPGTYSFAARVRARSPQGIILGVKEHGAPESQSALNGTNTQGRLSVTFTVTTQTALLYIYAIPGKSGGWADDLSLVDAAGRELLRRGSLEETGIAAGAWRLAVNGSAASLFRDNALLWKGTLNQHPAELWWEVNGTGRGGSVRFSAYSLITAGSSVASSYRIRSWEIKGGAGRRLTYVSAPDATAQSPEQENALPAVFSALEELLGRPLGAWHPAGHAGAAVLCSWAYRGGGLNAAWAFFPDFTTGFYHTPAHEMAHWYGPLRRDHPVAEVWLTEGIADFLANVTLNGATGRPWWYYDTHFTVPDPGWVAATETDPLLGAPRPGITPERHRHGGYWKGHQFLLLIAHTTGWDAFQRILRSPRGAGSGTDALREWGRSSSRSLDHLSPGWLMQGPYRGVSPADFMDNDGDGIRNFQETLFGTDPASPDSIRPGVSDLAVMMERDYGLTAPRLPAGGIFDGIPEVAPGETSVPLTPPWRDLTVRITPSALVGAMRTREGSAPEVDLNFTAVYLDFGTRTMKITWNHQSLNEYEWADQPGKRLAGSAPMLVQTLRGLEFLIPATHWQGMAPTRVTVSRLGLENGQWKAGASGEWRKHRGERIP